MEYVGGEIHKIHQENLLYMIIFFVEESLEMAGIIMFIRALMHYIADNYKEVLFLIDPD